MMPQTCRKSTIDFWHAAANVGAMLRLHEHQQKAVSTIIRAIDVERGPVMFTGATGSGKTAIAAALIKSLADSRLGYNFTTLFIAPSRSIVNQLPAELEKWDLHCSTDHRARWPGIGNKPVPQVLACTYAAAYNSVFKYGAGTSGFDLVVIDEAHHAYDDIKAAQGGSVAHRQATQLVRGFSGASVRVLGLTATLWLMSPYNGFTDTWKEHIEGPSWPQLSHRNLLARAEVIEAEPDARIVGGGKAAGEFTMAGIASANQDNALYTAGAVEWWQDQKAELSEWFLSTIVYASGQQHGVNVANHFSRNGYSTGLLLSTNEYLEQADGPVETDQTRAIERYRDKDIEVLVNVKKVSEGFDAPASDCVLFLRPTMSLALWVQACGRGSRIPYKNGLPESKDCVYVLDAAGNTAQHGRPDAHFEWRLDARKDWYPADQVDEGAGRLVYCVTRNDEGLTRITGFSDHPNTSHQIPRPASRHDSECPVCGAQQGMTCEGGCGKWQRWGNLNKNNVCKRCVQQAIVARAPKPEWHENPMVDSFDTTLYYPDWVGRLAHMAAVATIRPRRNDRYSVQIGVKVSNKSIYVIDSWDMPDLELARHHGQGVHRYALRIGDELYERLPARYRKRI